jgi:hypothetical protein
MVVATFCKCSPHVAAVMLSSQSTSVHPSSSSGSRVFITTCSMTIQAICCCSKLPAIAGSSSKIAAPTTTTCCCSTTATAT